MRQPLQVLVYPVRRTKESWEYLLLRRVASRGGFWQGVTGGVEPGEEMADAAARELFEETGLWASEMEQVNCSYSFPVADEWRDLYPAGVEEVVEHVFAALVSGEREPELSWEHDRWRWCSLDEALGLLAWPGNIEALQCSHALVEERLAPRSQPAHMGL